MAVSDSQHFPVVRRIINEPRSVFLDTPSSPLTSHWNDGYNENNEHKILAGGCERSTRYYLI